jgi:hypothetical protein
MTDREKLVELIGSTEYGNGSLVGKNFQQGFIGKIADHLLANGVTFATDTNDGSKWISVEDRLPENDVDVLCWYEYFRYGNYNRMYQTHGTGYRINGYWGGEVARGTKCKVIAWMPLPEPPKEE